MNARLTFELPIKTVSEANCAEHWAKKHKRHKDQKHTVNLIISGSLRQRFLSLCKPLLIKLTRISPRKMDYDDNLPVSMKYIRDYICDILFPGLPPGRADEQPGVKWLHEQRKGAPKEYKVFVEIF